MKAVLGLYRYCAIAVVAIGCGELSAAIIYVDESAAGGGNNGTSWNDAYTDLSEGLKAAQPGDEVRIGQGLYAPDVAAGSRQATFNLPADVIVQGGYAGAGAANPDANDPGQFPTILSGDLNGDDGALGTFENYADNSYNVVTANGVGSAIELRGVTIRGGNADLFTGCVNGFEEFDHGGGLVCENGASPTVTNVTFEANQAVCAGGAFFSDDGSAPAIHDSTFRFNRNPLAEPADYGNGGAIAVFGGSLTVTGSLFENNGPALNGGAINFFSGESLHLRSCTFIGNSSEDSGGAVVGQNVAAIDCQFIDNAARTWGGGFHGFSSDLINCVFLNNTCGTSHGGAVRSFGGGINMVNCHVSGNHRGAIVLGQGAGGPSSIINCSIVGNEGGVGAAGPVTIANSILWDNTTDGDVSQASQLSVNPAQATISNNTIDGWDGSLGGPTNTGEDPLMVDADGADNTYGTADDNPRLSEASPARDAGDNSFLRLDEHDLDQNGDTAEQIPLDLDLLTRVVNQTVDMGAYEFQGIGTCAADVDGSGDGQVNVDDLLALFNAWGPCASGSCPEDVNDDGQVNVDDLLAVINAWGPCS